MVSYIYGLKISCFMYVCIFNNYIYIYSIYDSCDCVCVYISQKIILNEPQSDSRILNGETTDFGGHQSEIKRGGNLGKPGGNRQPGETSGNLGETTEFLQNHLALHGSQAPPPQGRPPPKTTWCAVGFTRFAPTKMGH